MQNRHFRGWVTRFAGDRALERRAGLRALASAPGDGHAVLASQQWLSPQERAALDSTEYFDGGHFELIVSPALLARLIELL